MSKKDFEDVTALDVKQNSKITKQYLAKCLIDLSKLTTEIDNSINPVFKCEKLSENLDNICNINQIQSDIQSTITTSSDIATAVDNAIKQHTALIEKQLNDLNTAVAALNVSSTPLSSSEAFCSEIIPPETTNQPVSHNFTPVDCTVENFVSADERDGLLDFFSKEDFLQEGGRGVATYGERYNYMGHKTKPKPLPDCVKMIMDKLNKTRTADIYELNSCLVNRYEGPESSLPMHADDEYSINPNSDIFTVSIGESRKIVFTDTFSGEESEHTANPDSMYVMSRDSQNLFKHEIKSDSSYTGLRYSLTFRCVHWRYLNSTCVIGDSNTKGIKFGEGKGTVGESTPGKQVLTYTVEDINPLCCASYKNVVIVVGTNNLRSRDVVNFDDVKSIYSLYKGKILEIKKFNKLCNVLVVPVLPTKLENVNKKIMYFNNLIFKDLTQSCDNVSHIIGVSQFVDMRSGLLSESLSRDSADPLHISTAGVGILVGLIKSAIFRTKSSPSSKIRSSRQYSSVVSGRPYDDPH